MSVAQRLAAAFDGADLDDPSRLKAALLNSDLGVDQLEALLESPGADPYGRSRLIQARNIEVLVMNWAPGRSCAPHDHGASWGWVAILEGEAEHTVYLLDDGGVPRIRRETRVPAGRWIFAPKRLIHSMGNPHAGRLVTLHAYVPAIASMRVYDPTRCASCIVGDRCGAWWPIGDLNL